MLAPVHILATCLNPALAEATLLVFRTLRTGFPSSKITVWNNQLPVGVGKFVAAASKTTGCAVNELPKIAHDVWIERLATHSKGPFWVVDTDVVMFGSLECLPADDTYLMGRYEPPFIEPWSGTRKAARLHTSMLYIHPELVRRKLRTWMSRWHPKGFPFQPEANLYRQHYVPQGEDCSPLFYDSCAGLYQAIGGRKFTDEENNLFEHLHCGTYSDRISKAMPGILEAHKTVVANPAEAVGLRKQQEQYYKENAYA